MNVSVSTLSQWYRSLLGAVDGFVLSQAKTLQALLPISEAPLQR